MLQSGIYSTQSGIVCYDCCHVNNQHFFNSWILLICGCLLWFCRPTMCKEYIVVAQPSCLSNIEFHFTARYMPKRQGSALVLFFCWYSLNIFLTITYPFNSFCTTHCQGQDQDQNPF